MSKSVLNSSFLNKEQVPPYEETERQLKKQRKVNYNSYFAEKIYEINIFLNRLKGKKHLEKNGISCLWAN